MFVRALGCAVAFVMAVALHAAGQTADCPASKLRPLIPAIAPVLGDSPLWVTAGRGPTVWPGADKPIDLLLVRDRAVAGAAIVAGKHRASGGTARFGRPGTTAGLWEERYRLDQAGTKPRAATPEDLERYSFHAAEGVFPEPGCYEITGRVGPQQVTIFLNLEKRGPK